MVNLNLNPLISEKADLTVAIVSAGLISIIAAIFYGIKLKWFRYRMNFPSNDQERHPVLLRSHSVTEIRVNCSTGVYRKSLQDDNTLIPNDNDFKLTTSRSSSSPNNVKLKSSDRESIFRWPFRNKMSLNRHHSNEESSSRISSIGVSAKNVERKDKDPNLEEKNERIRKSIFERLNSSNSTSMPDLVNDSRRHEPEGNLTIQKGVEVLLDETGNYQTVEEIEEVPKVFVKPNVNLVNEISVESVVLEDDEENDIPPRPPTPIRRRSRSNSLKPIEPKEEAQELPPVKPPAIIPRKKHINYNKTEEPRPVHHQNLALEEDAIKMTPKSILKTQQQEPVHQTKTNVHFINVPDSSDDDEDDTDDIWRKISAHRDQLMKTEIPPPLPKTPPPSADSSQRNFDFA